MGVENRRQRIISVVILLLFMTLVSCLARESTEEVISEEKAETAAEIAGKDVAEGDTQENIEENTLEMEYAEADSSEENKIIFGKGISSEKSLPEDVVSAFQNGDTAFLVGVALGEEYDYDVYKWVGMEWYRPKECIFDWELKYLFDGEGHRFSGFYIRSGEAIFQGILFGKDPASMFVKSFGEPDLCEEAEDGKSQSASWYFNKAVLTVNAYEGYVVGMEYKALGDAADGGEDAGKKSDFELRMEKKAVNEKAEVDYLVEEEDGNEDVYFEFPVEEYSEDKVEEIIENYLEKQGFGGKTPDRIVCDEEEKIPVECRCYADDEESRFCFVVIDNTGVYCYIYCAVREIDETEEPEYLVCRYNEEGNVVQETGYDIWGMRMTEAFYTYYEGIPIPFVTKIWNTYDAGMLCREQKTWFSEKEAEVDDSGRVMKTGEIDWDAKSYFRYPCSFFYRSDGKIEKIQEEIPEKYFGEEFLDIRENYFGDMEFEYSKDGVLKKIYYGHSSEFYGTGDQSGHIDFDGQGRMLHNPYYMTHGCHREFFFYHGDEKRPWAVVDYCYGFWSIHVYQPVEEI